MKYEIIDLYPDQKAAVVPAATIRCGISGCNWAYTGKIFVDPGPGYYTGTVLWNETMHQAQEHHKDTEIRIKEPDDTETVIVPGHNPYTILEDNNPKGLLKMASNTLDGYFRLGNFMTRRAIALKRVIEN